MKVFYDGATYKNTITGRFLWASSLQTLTARTNMINLSNTLFERETPRHQYSKATIKKTNANQQYWCVKTPLSNFQFQYFRALKFNRNLKFIKFYRH